MVKQLIDLALLANNMLRGEELSVFVKRSVELL
jgi:molecular chaperone HtpG